MKTPAAQVIPESTLIGTPLAARVISKEPAAQVIQEEVLASTTEDAHLGIVTSTPVTSNIHVNVPLHSNKGYLGGMSIPLEANASSESVLSCGPAATTEAVAPFTTSASSGAQPAPPPRPRNGGRRSTTPDH